MFVLNSNAVYKQKTVKPSEKDSPDKLTFFFPEHIYYLQTHNLQIKILCSKTSTPAFRLGIRYWGKFLIAFFLYLHKSLFSFFQMRLHPYITVFG